MTALYKIADDFKRVEELDDMPEAIANTLEGIQLEFYDKAENIMALIKNMKWTSTALKGECESLITRKKANDNKILRLSTYLLTNLHKLGIKRVKRGRRISNTRPGSRVVSAEESQNVAEKLIVIKT